MSDIIEISELNFNDDNFRPTKGGNFGGGLELLMNDKVKETSNMSSDIDLEDLNNLENELNELSQDMPSQTFKSKSDIFNMGGMNGNNSFDDNNNNINNVRFNDEPSIGLGASAAESLEDTKTWDGYGKFNNIPLNPDKHVNSILNYQRKKF